MELLAEQRKHLKQTEGKSCLRFGHDRSKAVGWIRSVFMCLMCFFGLGRFECWCGHAAHLLFVTGTSTLTHLCKHTHKHCQWCRHPRNDIWEKQIKQQKHFAVCVCVFRVRGGLTVHMVFSYSSSKNKTAKSVWVRILSFTETLKHMHAHKLIRKC